MAAVAATRSSRQISTACRSRCRRVTRSSSSSKLPRLRLVVGALAGVAVHAERAEHGDA